MCLNLCTLRFRCLTPDVCDLQCLNFDYELHCAAIHKEIPTFMCIKLEEPMNWNTSENVVLKESHRMVGIERDR